MLRNGEGGVNFMLKKVLDEYKGTQWRTCNELFPV